MRENIAPFEARNKPTNTPEVGNDPQFDTAETVDDLLIDYVIPTTAIDPAADEIYEELDMSVAMKLPRLNPEDFNEANIIKRKEQLARIGQIMPGINDSIVVTPSVIKQPRPRLTSTDFTPDAIAEAKAQYFVTHPGEFVVDEIVMVDEVLKRNEKITVREFNEATLQDQYEDNERRRLGLKNPNDTSVLAPTRHLFDGNRTDNAVEGYKSIDRLRTAPVALSKPEKTVTVHVSKPTSDAFVRTGNLINPNATRLTPDKDFPRSGPRAMLPPERGMEKVAPKPSFFKRLVPKFISRLWNR